MINVDDIKVGQIVLYMRVPEKSEAGIEVGVVKEILPNNKCRCGYHLGDTCATTSLEYLYSIDNTYALKGLLERSEQLGCRYDSLAGGTEVWSRNE